MCSNAEMAHNVLIGIRYEISSRAAVILPKYLPPRPGMHHGARNTNIISPIKLQGVNIAYP